jgi:hypothetical protein
MPLDKISKENALAVDLFFDKKKKKAQMMYSDPLPPAERYFYHLTIPPSI